MNRCTRSLWRYGVAGALVCVLQMSANAGPLLDRLHSFQHAHAGQTGRAAPSTIEAANVHVTKDIAYGPASQQRLDVYAPIQAQKAPVVVMVHGGAWRVGDKAYGRVVDNKVHHWVSRGLVVVSVNYRMLPDAKPDIQLQDVARALTYVQQHAADWGADPHEVVLMGHSAGAHLVALLTADPVLVMQAGGRRWLGTVALDSAAYNLPEIMNKPHYGFYDQAFGKDATYWAQMSPLYALKQATFPFLAVCSSRRSDSCRQANAFVQKQVRLQGVGKLLPVDMSHSEINEQLGQGSDYTRQVDEFLAGLDARLGCMLAPR